jgi:2-polyprenyl-3-methyl-5-hydroxy-6-metoxy-1,4-benzoquinol methylase
MNSNSDQICDLCEIEDVRLVNNFNTWELIECNLCGLRWGTPKPDPWRLLELYNQNYFNSSDGRSLGYTAYESERQLRIQTFESWFEKIELFQPPGSCLDVGSALGFSLEAAEKRGWDAYGIEISSYAHRTMINSSLKGLHGDFLSLDLNMAFDVVTAWDVIEHVSSPRLFFGQANSCLKKGGILALTTPDCGALVARLSGRHWFEYKWPEHLFYLNRKSLFLYCEKFGFEVLISRPAVKFKFVADAIARWVGLYEAKPIFRRIFVKKQMRYSSFSEIFVIARKIS